MESLISRDVTEITARWKLALDYIDSAEMDHLPEEHAIRVLLRRDFPRVVRELTRLRPELQKSAAAD